MITILRYALLCIIGVAAFKMGSVRMQTESTRYCNPNIISPDNKAVQCHISTAEETKGLIYPGMDDGKSLTTRHDTFITKDGQVAVDATPDHPYEYIVTSETATSTSMIQLFNLTSYPIVHRFPTRLKSFNNFDQELTLEESGWTYQGLVEVNGEKLHWYITYGVNGTEPKTGMDFTALSMTGLIPNLWALYTDEADTKIVKIQAINTFQNNMVYQEDVVTRWEELPQSLTAEDALARVYSAYSITRHQSTVPTLTVAPRPEPRFLDSQLTGELTRLFFNDGKTPDWMPHGLLRGSNESDAPIEYFKIEKGSTSYEFFTAKYKLTSTESREIELPPKCRSDYGISKYCLYVNNINNDTIMGLQLYMNLVDVNNDVFKASLNLSVVYSIEDKKVVEFSFGAAGCATVFQMGVSKANVNIKVCLTGHGEGESLLQPDKATYRGEARLSLSFNLEVPVGTLSVELYAGFKCQAAPNNDIAALATVGVEDSRLVVGANIWVNIFGKTMEHKANVWEFEAILNLKVWAGVWIFKKEWEWSWPVFKAGPVTF